MKQMNLNSSLESKDSITCFWGKIQLRENIPVTTYRPTIRNKNLNYKETVQFHGHIITGDLILITNTKLRSILS